MKKILSIMLSIIIISTLILSGCGNTSTSSSSSLNIGIVQIMEHPSLDAARQGFLDALADNGYKEGENLSINYENAQGDMPTLNSIAQSFAGDETDLILAIATPSAQAVANATKGTSIPVLFTAVTDPVAAGLVESMEKPNTNLTGTTDMSPVAEQIKLIKDIDHSVKSVGVIYNTGEINSVVQVELVKEAAKELGLDIVEGVATNTHEVDQAAKSLVGKVDAIYVPTDNVAVTALEAIVQVAENNNILLVSAEKDSVYRGTVATIGLDYYKLGRQTGEMALRILSGEGRPQDMPVEVQEQNDVIINLKAAKASNITVPQELLDKAAEVIE
ncbi:MAG: ABC transporter substrate-binding protein [Thermoanaerobacteraceae bacterium]|mgnify:CR=1 FL=1|nr:ABC transporter substrate-binding protein [Thermoanaerobacteraceae bacterium]